MRKTPLKKRVTRGIRPRSNVDPTRAALSALERIREVLVKSGHEARLGGALSMKELAQQSQQLGTELPPSYVAAMRVASKIGEPEALLAPSEMRDEATRIALMGGEEAKRYAPFCRSGEAVVCFDKGAGEKLAAVRHEGELPIVVWQDDGSSNPVAAHFGEWLDMVADAREESVESAAKMPPRLKRLLYELGFRFEYPVVGRLETGDSDAVEELIGRELTRAVRGDVDRLFDSSGKASLTLNVDEFTVALSLRTGIYVLAPEDVFRWLRYFRDENFFGDALREPSHPDKVRDLRRAPREAPLVQRGVMDAEVQPAEHHVFRGASGATKDDFYLLARTASTSERAPSLVLHVVDGVLATSRSVDEPLHDLYVARDGTMWGLTTSHAVRIAGGRARSFPLQRPSRGRAWWYGIGGAGERVFVWGAGALLEFDPSGAFVPFSPDAMLDEAEAVVALVAHGLRLSMLVCGDRMGAVARFDSAQWQPIAEDEVLEGSLADLDVWRGTAYVLDRAGNVWESDGGPPRRVPLPSRAQAFLAEAGTPRPLHSVRAYDGGLLLASDGGVVAVGASEPVFHAAPGGREPVRLVRVGPASASGAPEREAAPRGTGIVALCGGNVWLWRKGAFTVLDMREL